MLLHCEAFSEQKICSQEAVTWNREWKQRCANLVLKGWVTWVTVTGPLLGAYPSTNTQAHYSHDWAKPHFHTGPCNSPLSLRLHLKKCCDHCRLLSCHYTLLNCCAARVDAQCCWDTCLPQFTALGGSMHCFEINTWQPVLYGYITVLKDVVQECTQRY